MPTLQTEVAVLGAGPGGYAAAIRAAQLGAQVVLIEKDQPGGTCLNRGCIPSKALIASAKVVDAIRHAAEHGIQVAAWEVDYKATAARKDAVVDRLRKGLRALLESQGLHLLHGEGRLRDAHTLQVTGKGETTLVQAEKIILATGSEPRFFPTMPVDHEVLLNSTDLLGLTRLPKHLAIIGGGVIGCECASFMAHLGVQVTLIEALPHLISTEGAELGSLLEGHLRRRGIRVLCKQAVVRAERVQDHSEIYLEGGEHLVADLALIAVGRSLNTSGLGFEEAGVALGAKGEVLVDATLRTNLPHLFAVGDITLQYQYAHWASYQGVLAAENACGIERRIHNPLCPGVIFTDPEIATVGMTFAAAQAAGYNAEKATFPLAHLGKAQADHHTEGMAELVVDRDTQAILGAQCIGADASSMIAEMALAIANELCTPEVSSTVHAHPTLSEAWQEAALIAQQIPLHSPPLRPQTSGTR